MLDFIERWFDVSPDNGNGHLEYSVIWALIILLVIGAAIVWRERAH
jgi:hypothetical protein